MDENTSTPAPDVATPISDAPTAEATATPPAPAVETPIETFEAVVESASVPTGESTPTVEVVQETPTPIIEQTVAPASAQGEIVQSAPAPTETPAPTVSSAGSAPSPAPVKTEAEVSAPLPTLESEVRRSSVDEILHALSPAQLKAIVKKYLYARSIEGRASRDVHLQQRKQLILKLIGERSRITRKEVMKLVGISRTGAKRYLNLLEKEGKIVQHGKIGPKVYYTLA